MKTGKASSPRTLLDEVEPDVVVVFCHGVLVARVQRLVTSTTEKGKLEAFRETFVRRSKGPPYEEDCRLIARLVGSRMKGH